MITAPRVPTRHLRFVVAAMLIVGCDAATTASTVPDAPYQRELTTAPERQSLANHSEKIVGGGGLNLTIYAAGSPSASPVVFIHGFSQNFMTWDNQFRGLADSFHLIAYDLRGHGASDKPLDADRYTQSSLWADDLAAVIRARNLQRPVLVGWSYGGYVIADYVRRFGDAEIGGLVFVGASTKNGTEEATGFLTDEVLAIFGDVLSADVRRSIEGSRALARLFTRPGNEEREVAFGSAMMVPPQIRAAMFNRVLDNDDVLSSIRVPTLVVHGAADRMVKLSAAQHTVSTVPGARLLVYQGVGHAPHLQAASRFNRDLAAFVGSLR